MVDADQVGRAEGGVMRALVFALIALLAAIAPTPAFAQPYPTARSRSWFPSCLAAAPV